MILRSLVVAACLAAPALAQQPVQPLPRVGNGCPLGYYSSGSYCVPSKSTSQGSIQKVGGSCPLGFYASGAYCTESRSSQKEAIQKVGPCPLGWYSSGSYCLRSR